MAKKRGKKYQDALKKVDSKKEYAVKDAVQLVKDIAYANFDSTIEVAFNLNVDTKQADQQLRGAVVLPNGTGKDQTVIVFANGENAKAAQEAGADFVGDDDLVEKIQDGWLDFDVAIATPDMMPKVGRLGRVLGPKGLMPNPKTGTVTMDVAKAVSDAKAGGADFVGDDDLVEKIQDGWLDFDVAIATPDMMPKVGRLGRVLGPKGLMPNPKTGTVTMDVAKAVSDAKAGQVTYRTDRDGNVAVPFGKVSFDTDKLVENLATLEDIVAKARPASVRGTYIKHASISSTFGPSVTLDLTTF